MSGQRIFIALDISDSARSACARRIDELRRALPKARVGWERAEKLHITLEFLGETDAPTLKKLGQSLSDAASRHQRFNSNLSGSGVFPSRSRARILWIGVDDEARIADLHKDVRAVCASLGFQCETKAFKPHITIGRVRDPSGSAELVRRHLDMKIEPVRFEVSDIVIYERRLQPTGSVYSVVSRLGLS